MTRFIFILSAFFTLMLIHGCGGGGGGGGNQSDSWTVLVYMAGDNDLSDAATVDLDEMQTVGSKNGINIVVQIDRLGDTAKRMFVRNGSSKLIKDLGEQNMADPATLEDFIRWGTGKYPADRTALILWSHGDGYRKPIVEPSSEPLPYSILEDDTDGVPCCLSNVAVNQAIEGAGFHFDLIGFDASRMGQTETAYEFRNTGDILVFSEENGNENGWEYHGILDALTTNPEMDSETLSDVIVQTYADFYENVYYPAHPTVSKVLTISAVRLDGAMDDFANGLDTLSVDLKSALDTPATQDATVSAVRDSRDSAQWLLSQVTCPIYVDLYDFLGYLVNEPGLGAGILEDISDLEDLKNQMILSEYHGADRSGATGLSIVFYKVPNPSCNNYDASYLDGTSDVSFVRDTHWNEFLTTYYDDNTALP